HILSREGHHIIAAHDGTETLAQLAENPIDLAVIDLHLPDMDGFELLGRLRATHPHLPILMLTASGHNDDRERAIVEGVNIFLTKPVSSVELINTVAGLLN